MSRFFLLVLFFLTLANPVGAVDTVKLIAPTFPEDKISNKKVGMRTFHKTPFHLKSEIHYNNENPIILIHNYRYGEAGWTYAPGRMEISYENMLSAFRAIGKTPIPLNEKIAVLGATAHSLMIANKLAKNGYPVTIYADNFSPNTFADMHARIFMPFFNTKKTEGELIDRLETLSYEIYDSWANSKNSNGFRGVYPVDLYLINDEGSFSLLVKKGLIPEPKFVDIAFNDTKTIPATQYKSFILDTPLIMKEMMHKAKSLGVKFVNKTINDLTDCLNLDANVVFNCIGLGSHTVFADTKIVPFVCHTLNLPDTVSPNYVVYVNHLDETYTYWLANNNKTTISGTFFAFDQESLSEATNIKLLIDRAKQLVID